MAPTPGPPNNPNICRMTMQFSRDTRVFVNTGHFYHAGGWTLSLMQQLAVDLASFWNLYYKQCVPNDVSLFAIAIRLLDPNNPLAWDLPISPASPGTYAGSPSDSANVSLTMSWRAGLAGRAYRGRMYIPGIPAGVRTVNDTVASSYLALVAGIAAHFVSLPWSNAVTPAIFHRNDNLFTPITSYVMEALLDSQRRRLPGRGR